MTRVEISAPSLVRNTSLNFIGQAVYLVVGIAAMPFVVRGLGMERFGLLALAWVILGYFTTFDLGLGRATTKYVAEALGKGEEDQVPRLAWTAVTIQGALGLLGALVLVGITSLLVERVLKIPPPLVEEAKATFHLLALAIPVVLVSSSFSGLLEAAQRFDLLNAVRIPSGASTFFLPLVGLALGFQLSGIVALIVLSRVAALAALVLLDLRLFPGLGRFSASLTAFPRLLAYGGWVTVTSLVGPVLLNLDRFFIASLLSMAAVAYYTAPYEIAIRLWIIPASLTMSLFPAFSALEGMGDRHKLGTLFARSVVYALLALAPVVLILGLFAQEILHVWLGSDFAAQSKLPMQILVVGALVGSAAQIPYALLQGAGRPDITAKIHLLELPLYVGIAWVLISRGGVVGAAAAWSARVTLDAVLLFVASFRVCRLSPRSLAANGLTLTSVSLVTLAAAAYGLRSLGGALPLLVQLVLFAVLLGFFALTVWKRVLDDFDRAVVLRAVTPWQGRRGTPWG